MREGKGRSKEPAHETTRDGLTVISASRAALWLRVSKLDWLTADESAIYVRASISTFEGMVIDGPIPFFRPAGPRGNRRFFRSDLDKFLISRRENTSA